MMGVLLVSLVREFPDTSSSDPSLATVGGGGRAFGVRGKLHPLSLWLAIPHCQTRWTLKARNPGFFHLSERHRNCFGKRTYGSFTHRGNACFPNGITSWCTLAYMGLGRFRRDLWERRCGRGRFGILLRLGGGWHSGSTSLRLCCLRFCRLLKPRLELLRTLAIVDGYFLFACACLHLQTQPLRGMKHSSGEDILSQAGSSLRQGCLCRIDQPVLQHSNRANTVFGKPPPAFEKAIQVDIEGNPFEQVRKRCHKLLALFFVAHMVALKMNISTPTS